MYETTGVNTWDDVACTGTKNYVCEISTPATTPPEDQTNAHPVGLESGKNGDLKGGIFAYQGSTRRMDHEVDFVGTPKPMSQCGAATTAPDAVFLIRPSLTTTASIDTSGSAFPAIVGLFDTTIDAAGYIRCDAPGVAPGVNVTQPDAAGEFALR